MSSENKFYQKWWFWAIIGVVILGVIINFSSNSSNSSADLTGQVTNNENLENNNVDSLVQEEPEVKNCLPQWKCSAWSVCGSMGQQTRICTDSNNCGKPETKLPETQTCTPPTWHEVTIFSGSDTKTTDTFNIKGDKFKLTYYTIAENYDYDSFSFFVYPEGETALYVEYASLDATENSQPDSTISYEGAGTYYLKVLTANLASWRVQIEDYY